MKRQETARRGFAAMPAEKRRANASKAGKAVRPENRSFSRDRELAAAAGQKGGHAVPPEQRAFSKDRALAARAGRAGGRAGKSGKGAQ